MTELDLLYTEIEDELRASVRSLLDARWDPDAVTRMYDADRSVVDGLWKALSVEIGLGGLLVPEDLGGAGGSVREAAVVLEELGRMVAPVPFLTSAVIATTVLLESVLPGPGTDLLGSIASGEQTAALAVTWSAAPDSVIASVSATEGRLTGTITSVAGALEADVLLVPASTADGIALYAVSSAEVSLTPVVSLDMTRQLAHVAVDGATGTLVNADAAAAIRRALEVGAALLASEQLGLSRWCLEATVDYVKERRQFGRVVGGFQALKHRLADLYTAVESAAAAARYAAATVAADDPDASVAASVAQAFCGEVAVTAAEEAVQMHAGIGMTWEHPTHLYLKRAKADQIALGTSGRHRARLAELVNLPR